MNDEREEIYIIRVLVKYDHLYGRSIYRYYKIQTVTSPAGTRLVSKRRTTEAEYLRYKAEQESKPPRPSPELSPPANPWKK